MDTEDLNKLMFYDFDFTLFFRKAYRTSSFIKATNSFLEQIMNRVKPNTTTNTGASSARYYQSSILDDWQLFSPASDGEQKKVTQYYKDLVKNQDTKITELQNRINMLQMEIALVGEGDSKELMAKCYLCILSVLMHLSYGDFRRTFNERKHYW